MTETHLSSEEYDRLVEAVYRAAVEPERWSEFIEQLSASLDQVWLSMHGHDLRNNFNTGLLFSRYDPAEIDRYFAHYASINPWIDGLSTTPVGEVRRAEALLPRSELFKTEFYNDWIRPQDDIGTGGGIVLFRDDERMLFISGNVRLQDPGAIQDKLMEILTRLGPHLKRAFDMQRLLGTQLTSSKNMAAALDALPNAIVLLDRQRKIVHCNGAAENLLDGNEVLRRGKDRALQMCDTDAQSTFERQFGKIVHFQEPETLPITVPVATSPIPRMATLTPFKPDERRIGFFADMVTAVTPVALLCFAPVSKSNGALQSVLASFYRLTPAEIRLAIALADGSSLSDYARTAELSIETVRTQVKLIFGKTDTHRQGELVALLNRFT